MTVKAGQKCTAIRRALVPRQQVGAVAEALRDRLARTVVGDPENETVRMGPLASLAQRDEVRERVRQLASVAAIVAGDPDAVDAVAADPDRGAFMAPILLQCDEPERHALVHDLEAFGPVSTLLPYDRRRHGDRSRQARRRQPRGLDLHPRRRLRARRWSWAWRHTMAGSSSPTATAPRNSTGHGSPLPGLVHGGPGRAGGGEELGGIRSVMHYLQRTALQGSPATLSHVTGTWIAGAPRRQTPVHPFRKHFEELEIGDAVLTGTRTITLEDIEHFARFTGDVFYAHMDEAAAKANPFFDGRVAHGYFIVSAAAGLFVDPDPGPVLANYGVDHLRFLTPVYPGDTLGVALTCKQKTARANEGYGEVRWDCTVTNQDGRVVAQYDVLTLVQNRAH